MGKQLLAADLRYEPVLAVSAPRLLFEGDFWTETDHFAEYDVGPGELGFVMVQSDDTPAQRQVHVMLNWLNELERLVPTK